MEPTDSVEALPSEDNGNIPLDTPIVEPTPVAEPVVEPVEPAVPEAPLYELPDGRKVDGETVAQEYKNLLSDYTRKSQELAKAKPAEPLQTTTENPLDNPEWVPQSYKELVELTKQMTRQEIEAEKNQALQAHTELENRVANEITALKTSDKDLNENELFAHATKYRFTDLNIAYNNMKDMKALVKNTQQATVKNIAKKNDPVSMSPGATGAKPNPANFRSATEYLRSLK